MPVSKRRLKQSGRITGAQAKSGGMVFMKDPFSNLPREAVLKGLVEIGKTHQDEFPARLSEVESILRSVDPLLTISMLATYGLMGSVEDNGHVSAGYMGEEFNQSHVELAQALYLRVPFAECSREFPKPDTIQHLFELLSEVAKAYSMRRFVRLQEEQSDENKATMVIQEELRLHTQTVRNWGFLSRVAGITKRLCAPIDDVFLTKIGIPATTLIDLFTHLIRRYERLVNERIKKLAPAFRETTVGGMLDAYYTAYPHLEGTSAEMVAFAMERGITLDQMKSMLLSHSDLSLDGIYTLDVGVLASETGIDAPSIASALDHLSLGFGDLAERNPEHFFLTNQVWTKPVIRLAGGKYFCAMPQTFFSFVFPILAELLEGDDSAAKKYEKRRAEFLESDIRELFGKAFPGCEIGTGYKWRDGADEYENDLMVRVDSHLILVEVKSHAVSWSALRGAPRRARRHVKEMLLDPSIQSLRLATYVEQSLADKSKRESLPPNFPVSLDQVRTVLRLSVTLEDFATLQTTLHHAKKANWIPSDHPIAPCILLADLEIVFDVLESTPHKIHYIKRRADLEAHFDYKGDELDLLGFYLQSGFNVGEAEYSGHHFAMVGMSKQIDRYYTALEEGIITNKPVPKMTPWWKDICAKIEARDIHQWSDVANVLLGVSFEDQEAIAKKFKQIVKNVHKNWRKPGHNCAIVMVPHKKRTDALAVVAFKERDKGSRHTRMENVAAGVFESSHVERCLVIGINIDKSHYPYSLIGVFFKGKEDGAIREKGSKAVLPDARPSVDDDGAHSEAETVSTNWALP